MQNSSRGKQLSQRGIRAADFVLINHHQTRYTAHPQDTENPPIEERKEQNIILSPESTSKLSRNKTKAYVK